MREIRPARQLHSNPRPHGGRGQGEGPPAQRATNYLPARPAGEASVEQAELDAAAAWLKHVRMSDL